MTGNIYPSKTQVFLTGGPQNQKASGLPDGLYYFQVTDPSGSTLLSNDPAACRQVVISGGRLAGAYDPVKQVVVPAGTPLDSSDCEHASSIVPAVNGGTGAAVQVGGAFHSCAIGTNGQDIFCDTPNPGGEYKIWLIAQSSASNKCNTTVNSDGLTLSFDHNCAKTDNFKSALPAVSHVVACEVNDANGNGVLDPGELMISGWPITATVPAASYVTLRSDTQAGSSVTATTDSTGCVSFVASGIPVDTQVQVTVTEGSQLGWTQTAPADGTYDASGKSALSGPTSVLGAVPSTGVPASGGIISVNLGPGSTVTSPILANTDPKCPDCSILGAITVVNAATPEKLYTWGITKTVDKAEIDNVSPGGSAVFNYTVSVTHDNGAGSLLTGSITLINADGSNPSATLNVVDTVSDGGVCRIQDPATQQYVAEVFNLTINSFTEMTLPYQCTYAGSAPTTGTNTVTATNLFNNSAQYTGAASYNFGIATASADQTAAVTDSLKGSLGTVSFSDPSPRTFQYSYTFTNDPAGSCTSHNNTATATASTTGTAESASQGVSVCVSKTTPSIATTPNSTNVTAGSATPLKDSAVISGGTNPTGTITFTLIFGGQTVDTEIAAVNGSGTYTTPTGYTLPTTGTIVGTYQWNASYSGDASNTAVSESGNTAEQVTVNKVPNPLSNVSLTGIAPCSSVPGCYEGNVEAAPGTVEASVTLSGVNPTGTITFTMLSVNFIETICSTTVNVTGNGMYHASCNGLSQEDFEGWVVTYSGDSNNAASTQKSITFVSPL